MILSTTDVINWLQPWPIRFLNPRGRNSVWEFSVLPLKTCLRFKAFWPSDRSYHNLDWWVREAMDCRMDHDQHYVHMLARTRIPVLPSLTILVSPSGGHGLRVLDGNHHLIAAGMVGVYHWQGLKTPLTHVGVLALREKE